MVELDKNKFSDANFIPLTKIRGGLLGSIIGDALGWPQELIAKRADKTTHQVSLNFQSWQRRSGGRFWNHIETIRSGEYSDDSQLLLATGRSLQFGKDWFYHLCRYELPIWLMYERGGGRATRASAQLWEKGTSPWDITQTIDAREKYFMSGGNGVAMRVLPHSLISNQTFPSLQNQVILNGIATHGHPKAIIGAILIAIVGKFLFDYTSILPFGGIIEFLLDNRILWTKHPEVPLIDWTQSAIKTTNNRYFEYWDQTINETIDGLISCQNALRKGALSDDESVIRDLGGFDPKINGAGTVTSLSAIYLASRYASDPATGVFQAAYSTGTDTDTVASLVGGLLGTLHGTDWIRPEWSEVQDKEYIDRLAEEILATKIVEDSIIRHDFSGWTKNDTDKTIQDLQTGGKIVALAPFGKCILEQVVVHHSASNINACSYVLKAEIGQRIYIKTLSRGKKLVEDKKQDGHLAGLDQNRQPRMENHAPQVIDPGIYINIFEVIFEERIVKIYIADRTKFQDLKGLRSDIFNKNQKAYVYAWENSVYGYGQEGHVLQERGFKDVYVNLLEHAALTKRMILEGYTTSLQNAGYTIFWNKEIAQAFQMSYPLLDLEGKLKLFRGFELRMFSSWDDDNQQNSFGIIIDTIFTYRDPNNTPLSISDITKKFGSNVLKLIRQKQGELSPSGAINLEASRSKLMQTIIPFVNVRHSFELSCGIRARLQLTPTRVTMVDGGNR